MVRLWLMTRRLNLIEHHYNENETIKKKQEKTGEGRDRGMERALLICGAFAPGVPPCGVRESSAPARVRCTPPGASGRCAGTWRARGCAAAAPAPWRDCARTDCAPSPCGTANRRAACPAPPWGPHIPIQVFGNDIKHISIHIKGDFLTIKEINCWVLLWPLFWGLKGFPLDLLLLLGSTSRYHGYF